MLMEFAGVQAKISKREAEIPSMASWMARLNDHPWPLAAKKLQGTPFSHLHLDDLTPAQPQIRRSHQHPFQKR